MMKVSRSKLDKNGYAPSIMQSEECCYMCGRRDRKLDRHEPMQGIAYREKSKADGLWVLLCHVPCHEGQAHGNREVRERLCRDAQEAAMRVYGWSVDDWRRRYGKNWL